MLQDQKIFLVTQKDPQIEEPGFVQLFQVGTVAYIKQVVKLPDNLLRVLVEGTRKGRASWPGAGHSHISRAETVLINEEEEELPQAVLEAMYRSIRDLFHSYCTTRGQDWKGTGSSDHEYRENKRADRSDLCESASFLAEQTEASGSSEAF